MFKISWLFDFLLGPKFYFDSGDSTPDKTTQTQELPEWARGYAKDTLAKASALTDINQNPYQEYGGQRIAGFDPMQQKSFQNAANMQPSQQVGLGSGIAGAAGLGALNTNYQGGQFQGGQFDSQAAQQYMNPYTQNVVDYQKSQAIRDFQVAQPGRNAQAVGSGAFGGSRQAIVDAEAQRNLSSQLQGIEATGQQQAYQNAQQQFNADQTRRLQAQGMGEASRQYGADLGMKGLSTGLQAASTLGQLGQTQYGQEMGINQLQNQYGAQQQQQAQRGLDTGYQDFLNQQNYPYKQLGFMSDMVRGLPLGQQSTASIYSQGPSAIQTLAGLGGAAYGFGNSGMFGGTPSSGGKSGKEGGLMESYADGGVTSDQNVESILTKLSDQQLAQAKETALNRRDVEQAQMIDAEMAERASIRSGLGGAFNQIPVEQQEEMMAGGGMVAFAPGGVAKGKDTYGNRFEQSLTDLKAMANTAPAEPTPEQRDEDISARIPLLEKRYGPDITKPYLEETKTKRAGLADQMEKDKGLAFAMSSLKLLSRNKKPGENQNTQFISGLGEAGEAFIGEVGRLKKENREIDDKLRQSEILLTTAQQSRKEGLINKADAEANRAQDLKRDAFKTNIEVQGKVAQLTSGLAQQEMQGENALRVAGVTAAAGERNARISAAKETDLHRQTNIRFAALVKQGKPADEQTMAEAAGMAAGDLGKYPSTDRASDARATFYEKISSKVDDRLATQLGKKYRELQKEDKKTGGNSAERYREQLIAVELDKAGSQGQPAPGAAQPAPNAQQQAAPVAKPSLDEFLPAARKANQGVSDADLIKYYNNKYGK